MHPPAAAALTDVVCVLCVCVLLVLNRCSPHMNTHIHIHTRTYQTGFGQCIIIQYYAFNMISNVQSLTLSHSLYRVHNQQHTQSIVLRGGGGSGVWVGGQFSARSHSTLSGY